MDVPYHSSGAMSRAHYAIVRKVEAAPSSHSADKHIVLEIQSVQARLSHPKLRLSECKECLVILLYCALSVTPGFLPKDAFDFAFPHAISLAEAGKSVEDKRLAYLFCEEIIPREAELRLMLVNTLRKDLESDDIAQLCLALDNLISSPTEDVIPAVQSRLHDLLSHDYSHVRRRALFALHSLSTLDRALVERIRDPALLMLQDEDESVVKAALIVARQFASDRTVFQAVNDLLKAASSHLLLRKGLLLSLLECLVHLGLADDNIPKLLGILLQVSSEKAMRSLSKAILLDIFKLLGQCNSDAIVKAERSQAVSIVQSIRQFLVSQEADDVHFFLSCLEKLDVALWAGTDPDYPAVLDSFEFERIMQLLNSADQEIRRKTLTIVNQVDPTILDVQLSVLLDTSVSGGERFSWSMRILEILSVRFKEDGEAYASHAIELTRRLDEGGSSSQVFREVIEAVLNTTHTSTNSDFLSSSANHFVRILADPDAALGSTAFVIATALTTESAGNLSVPASALLLALAKRLQTCLSIVQEPCLIAMMRILAEVDEVPLEVVDIVQQASKTMRRSITTRCRQFLDFAAHKADLVKIINENPTAPLPDFLASLQSYSEQGKSAHTTPQPSRASSRASGLSASQLRYAAYDPPEVVPRLRTRKATPARQDSPNLTLSTDSHQVRQAAAALVSPGDLALAEGLQNLRIEQNVQLPLTGSNETTHVEDAKTSGIDLINLESPHPAATPAHDNSSSFYDAQEDFKAIWDTFGDAGDLRGWCNFSMDALLRLLQGVDQYHLRVIPADDLPFKGKQSALAHSEHWLNVQAVGELKIVMISRATNIGAVVLRLRESDEDSCLWRLRCADPAVGRDIQAMLDK